MAKKQKTKKIKLTNSQKKIIAKRQLKMRNRLIFRQFGRLRTVFKQLRGEIDPDEQLFISELAWETFSTQLYSQLKKGMRETVNETAKFVATQRNISNELIPAIKNDTLKKLSEKVIAEKVTNITETTKETINKIIVNGQKSGTNIKEIAEQITQKVENMEKTRAMVIARTETATTSTTTYLEGLIKAGLPKTWRHVGGGKTDRPTHLALDNVTIEDASEPFSNGMMCPHDLNADVSELIHCHCELV